MSIEKLIMRVQNPQKNKRQLFVSTRKLHRLIESNLSYKTFIETNISWSRLRENIDYHLNKNYDTYNLSISAVQAILVTENTEQSWRLFNELSDLINNGFNLSKGV
ncbi:hypothetical protein F909_00952 [Acinetobacter sp. ANC 3929]|uniref:antA/AntB antirepressor family protein n=1 Tax=Acinetobacter sp. ANC 3929 TaxID=1217707 RepID=UPI0002CFE75F|nr:antA/AntB antirepressor family protein [Acinetobacter sp. ANC 3929]ENW82681.1 hypothetical protein F909_00952 [Acinetobacter sp. ANC 3929]